MTVKVEWAAGESTGGVRLTWRLGTGPSRKNKRNQEREVRVLYGYVCVHSTSTYQVGMYLLRVPAVQQRRPRVGG